MGYAGHAGELKVIFMRRTRPFIHILSGICIGVASVCERPSLSHERFIEVNHDPDFSDTLRPVGRLMNHGAL